MGRVILCLDDEHFRGFNSQHKNILLRVQTDQFNWIHGHCQCQSSQTHIFPVNFLLCTRGAPATLCKFTLKPWQWLINSIYLNLFSFRSQSIPFSCTHYCPKSMPWNTWLMSAVTEQFMKPL